MAEKYYWIVGVMSGTSLDGVDIALCRLSKEERVEGDSSYSGEIVDAVTVSYSNDWLEKLQQAPSMSGSELLRLHNSYGRYLGREVKRFIGSRYCDIVASHGHTIFHTPESRFTFQLGHGASIAAESGIKTVADFRTTDVALGGEGAPLVPIGDMLLFSDYKFCLNLGGFSNISIKDGVANSLVASSLIAESFVGERLVAGDISPANMALNSIVAPLGLAYDDGGEIARGGVVDADLLKRLDALPFYRDEFPKSLGREWYETVFAPVVRESNSSVADKLATCCEHIAKQIASIVTPYVESSKERILITGGGALNSYLIERVTDLIPIEVVTPDRLIIDYKEAYLFALLGQLYMDDRCNALSCVTGATRDSIGGVLYK